MLYLDYAAIFLEFVLLLTIIMRKMIYGKLNHVFIFLVTTAMLTVSMDIISVVFGERALLAHDPSLYYPERMTVTTIYLLMRAMTSFFYMNYVVVMTDTWFRATNLIKKICIFLPIFLLTAMMIANIFLKNIFYFNQDGIYTRGDYFIFLYIINAYYAAYGFYKIFRYRKLMGTPKVMCLTAGAVLMMGAAVIQFIFKGLLVDMFASAIGLLFIFMLVQRPEEILDTDTGLIKLSTYVYDMNRSFMNKKPETLIMIKILNFSELREILGYSGSVELKRILAEKILKYLKGLKIETDVYYTGSGNYRIKLYNKNRQYSQKIAEYFNDDLKESFIYHQINIELSSCVCITNIPEDIDSFESLREFENHLGAEHTGNVVYAADICKMVRYDLVHDMNKILENAITNHEFEIYYQPIYSIQEKRFHSAEAVLRLNTEKYGFISPELFIPAAEKSGAIHRIGMIVMESVCEFIGSEEFKTLDLDYIEVNLSPVQCMDSNLSARMFQIIKKNHVLPCQLNLEITETASGEIQNVILQNITQLHHAGISLSLDDFGTGYSNMKRIASLPFTIIKLDKTLTDLENNPNLMIVLENVIKMIKALNMKIVVEGIETEELVQKFSQLGCEYIQGYYYSKPLTKEKFISFLKQQKQA